MNDIKVKANHAAWERWQSARKVAAREQSLEEWQRLNRFCTVLDPYAGLEGLRGHQKLTSRPSK